MVLLLASEMVRGDGDVVADGEDLVGELVGLMAGPAVRGAGAAGPLDFTFLFGSAFVEVGGVDVARWSSRRTAWSGWRSRRGQRRWCRRDTLSRVHRGGVPWGTTLPSSAARHDEQIGRFASRGDTRTEIGR